MRVVTASSAGFCWGVNRAIKKTRALRAASASPVYTDGPLIHNEAMLARLREEGIRETDDPGALASGTLVVRAHGISPTRHEQLARLPLHLVDATCPDVAKIQSLIASYADKGYAVIIFGDPGHAEVTGLLGFAAGRGHVVAAVPDIARLPPDLEPVCLVAQSTQLPAAYEKLAAHLRERYPGLIVLDTICRATRNRQEELVELAGRVDAIVVVGGCASANTLRLVELASTLRPTHHVQNAEQIKPADFRNARCVGLTAGASTPAFLIEAVRARLESL